MGEFTTGDERVIIRDIPLVVGSGTSMPEEAEGDSRLQPLGLYNFKGSGSSLDNTHSNSSSEQLPQVGGLINPFTTTHFNSFLLATSPSYPLSPFTLLAMYLLPV